MSDARQKIAELTKRIAANPGAARAVGAVYRFVLNGDGGGSFLVNLKDEVGVSEIAGPADCTITLDAADFPRLMEDPTSGQQLFFTGKLQIDGDIGLALKLAALSEL